MGQQATAINASVEQPQPTPKALNMGVPARGINPPAIDRRKVTAARAEAAKLVKLSTM